jgi:hypothetical protein
MDGIVEMGWQADNGFWKAWNRIDTDSSFVSMFSLDDCGRSAVAGRTSSLYIAAICSPQVGRQFQHNQVFNPSYKTQSLQQGGGGESRPTGISGAVVKGGMTSSLFRHDRGQI